MTSQPEIVEIDLSRVESVEQLHVHLQERFQFPIFYGRSWDAFWDSINWLVELPHRIRLLGWQSFESRFPRDARIMRECFTEYPRDSDDSADEIEYALRESKVSRELKVSAIWAHVPSAIPWRIPPAVRIPRSNGASCTSSGQRPGNNKSVTPQLRRKTRSQSVSGRDPATCRRTKVDSRARPMRGQRRALA